MFFKIILFLYATSTFSLTVQSFNKKIQKLQPFLEKAKIYGDGGKTIKVEKQRKATQVYLKSVFSNTKKIDITNPCYFTFNDSWFTLEDLQKFDYKIYNITCNEIENTESNKEEEGDEGELSIDFLYYNEFVKEYLNPFRLFSFYKNIINSTVANVWFEPTVLEKIKTDMLTLEASRDSKVPEHLQKYFHNAQELIQERLVSIQKIENEYLQTLEALSVIIQDEITPNSENSPLSIKNQATIFKKNIIQTAQYVGTLSILPGASTTLANNWLSSNDFYEKDTIYISAIPKKINLSALVINDIAIPVAEIKRNNQKALALKYFPNEYCNKYFKVKYLENEKRCQTEEESSIEKDPIAYCQKTVGQQLQYRPDLKRCETAEERSVRLLTSPSSTVGSTTCGDINDSDCDGIPNTKDIDVDGDGLIEIKNPMMLHNIRYNLDGTSYKTSYNDIGITNGCAHHHCLGYELIKNINLSGVNWIPIGNSADIFSCTFNGNDYEIQNLTITSNDWQYVGLFGYIGAHSNISNIGLVHSKINATYPSDIYVGGLVGYNKSSNIKNSYVKGNISVSALSSINIGGLVGVNELGSVTSSYTKGTITILSSSTQYARVGGLVGINKSSEVSNSYTKENIHINGSSTQYAHAGGLVGVNKSSNILHSYAKGNISISALSSAMLGGLVGLKEGGSIKDSVYNSSAIFTERGVIVVPAPYVGITAFSKISMKSLSSDVVKILGTSYKFTKGKLPKVYKNGSITELVAGQ